MGNYRFKFSDMIPNAWFYKLKDLTKHPTRNHTKKKHQQNTSVSNHTDVTSPALTSPSTSSTRNHHHLPSSSFSSQNHHSQSQYHHQRKSYYFTRDINKSASSPIHDNTKNFYEDAANGGGVVQLPRRSSSKKRQSTRRSRASPRLANSSVVRTGYSCRSSIESLRNTNSLPPETIPQEYPNSAADTSSETEPKSNLTGVTSTETIESTVYSSYSWSSSRLEDDIVIDLKSKPPPPPPPQTQNSARHFDKHIDGNNWQYTEIELPPVKTKSKEIQPITKTRKQRQTTRSDEESQSVKNEKSNQNSKRFSMSSHSPGLKLRTNTPRIVTRNRKSVSSSSSNWRKSLSDSFAVVTSSKDPERDFRESMVEMIVEHNISSSKELEDLLACYLSLNSYKHHDVIINVFKQIWFEFLHT